MWKVAEKNQMHISNNSTDISLLTMLWKVCSQFISSWNAAKKNTFFHSYICCHFEFQQCCCINMHLTAQIVNSDRMAYTMHNIPFFSLHLLFMWIYPNVDYVWLKLNMYKLEIVHASYSIPDNSDRYRNQWTASKSLPWTRQ